MKFKISSILISILSVQMLYGQCTNTDANIWKNSWQSCQTTESPREDRGVGHWIMYDLGAIYQLSKTRVWNANEAGKTNVGFKNVIIDYSIDGTDWIELGQFKFAQGNGKAIYGGFEAFDFAGEPVRFVLITALDNWGNADCYGLAEIKFNVLSDVEDNIVTSMEDYEPALSFEIYPNPLVNECALDIQTHKREKVEIVITNVMGKEIDQFVEILKKGSNTIEIDLESFTSGVYFVTIHQRSTGKSSSKRLLLTRD